MAREYNTIVMFGLDVHLLESHSSPNNDIAFIVKSVCLNLMRVRCVVKRLEIFCFP